MSYMFFFFVRDSFRPAYEKLDVLFSIFPNLLCMELLEKKTDMPLTLIYGTLDVCTFVMFLVKTSTFHLRHLLKWILMFVF